MHCGCWQSPEESEFESEVEQPWRPHAAFRIAAELGAGALTGVGLTLVGVRLGSSLCPQEAPEDPPDSCTLYPFLGGWLGSGLGFALGTWWGGSLLGGRGHILHTLGGMALGMAAGAGAFVLARGNINPLSGAAMLLPYALSVVAFEMSSSAHLQPMLSFTPRGGAVLGLAGRF
ncbi:hypothetical protein ACN28E_27655 [Archangium lansingense]|uniref:hypothetical protein n=1 Tax=Archangium lansingense TaxID=2995310 RepID=UPI003B79841C